MFSFSVFDRKKVYIYVHTTHRFGLYTTVYIGFNFNILDMAKCSTPKRKKNPSDFFEIKDGDMVLNLYIYTKIVFYTSNDFYFGGGYSRRTRKKKTPI